jgi:hypothetical protein
MKLKIFSVKSGNRQAQFDTLEANVNDWLAEHHHRAHERPLTTKHELVAPCFSGLVRREVATRQPILPAHIRQYVRLGLTVRPHMGAVVGGCLKLGWGLRSAH